MTLNNFTESASVSGWTEELLHQFMSSVREYAIFFTDPQGTVVGWNAGAEEMFGYSPDEVIGRDVTMLYTAADLADEVPTKEMETALREDYATDERWHELKDGTRIFASGILTAVYDEAGTHTGYVKILRDFTERALAQQELSKAFETIEERTNHLSESNDALRLEIVESKEAARLKTALLRKIVKTQEDERKRIARDIHDQMGQQVTGLRLRLQLLADRHSADAALAAELAQVQAIAEAVDSQISFLAWELRPSVLDDFGLISALEIYVNDWATQYGVEGTFEQVGMGDVRLEPEVEINLYRIAQEALNNVAKHAKATNASVLLERRDGRIGLIVEDDGVGFSPLRKDRLIASERGIGLLSMKERAELVGGTFEIESSKGGGTTVFARVPAGE